MTDLDQKVEEARRVFVEKIARMALTTGPVQPNGSGDAYAALEAAIAERATRELREFVNQRVNAITDHWAQVNVQLQDAVERVIADLPALGRSCGSYEQAAGILTERLRAALEGK